MQETIKSTKNLTAKKVKIKFNQIAVNRKYRQDYIDIVTGKSLWNEAKEEYIAQILKNPMFGGVYKYLPNEDDSIKNIIASKIHEPYQFERATNMHGQVYSLDDIRKMTDKERAGLPFYEMTEDEAAFYLDEKYTRTRPRDDTIRVYKRQSDFDRDCQRIPLAEIVD